jgi:hypothetical protein
MKTAFIEQFRGPEVLKYGAPPDPVAAPGEAVIDVVAGSVNGPAAVAEHNKDSGHPMPTRSVWSNLRADRVHCGYACPKVHSVGVIPILGP